MLKHRLNIVLFFLLLVMAAPSFSQDTTKTEPQKMIVVKNDGSKYTGYILEDDAREILINTDEVGKLYIPKHMIESIKPYDPNAKEEETTSGPKEKEPEKEPVLEEEQPKEEPPVKEDEEIEIEKEKEDEMVSYTTTKNIISDNALPILRGESFLKFTPIGIEFGLPIMDNWSVGGFTSYWGVPVGIKTKYSFHLAPKAWLSVDAGYGSMAFGTWANGGIDDGGLITSLSFTYGERLRNFTFKAGYGYIHQGQEIFEWDDNLQQQVLLGKTYTSRHLGFVNFGGMLMLTKKSTFTFDATAVYMDDNFGIAGGAAIRFGRNPRRQWQFGGSIIFVGDQITPIPFPHISHTIVFEERKR